MANKREDTIYVRNARPNMIAFRFNSVRYKLEHRGSRQDSTALPAEAEQDAQVSKWLRNGQLEKISKEAFVQLGKRRVDVLPNEFLKRNMRTAPNSIAVQLGPAEADATRSKTQVSDEDARKFVRNHVSPEWAGDLMSTEEELETLDFSLQQEPNYPSKHRDE